MQNLQKLIGGSAALMALGLTCLPAPLLAVGQSQRGQKREPAACAKLHDDYEMASKRLALYSAQGAVGGAAAKNRAARQTETTMSEARMTLDLLRANGCRMPTWAPTRERYLMQGLTCVSDMIGASARPPSCILENWKPEK